MPSSIMYSCREVSELLFERGILRKFLMMLLAAVGLLICSIRSEARDAYVRLACWPEATRSGNSADRPP